MKKQIGIAILALGLSLGSPQPVAAQTQHAKIDAELQKLNLQKQAHEQRAAEIRCHLGRPTASDDCTALLLKATVKTNGNSADCSKLPENSVARENCEIGKKLDEFIAQNQKNNKVDPNSLADLQRQKADSDAQLKGLEKELAAIPNSLKNTEKEIANLLNQKGKSEALLQAEENYKLAREDYREAAKDLPRNATAEERKKLLAAHERKSAAAARDLYRVKAGINEEDKKNIEASFEKCISAISTYDPINPGSTDLATVCSGVGPGDANYTLAALNTPEGKDERKRIKKHANEQKKKSWRR